MLNGFDISHWQNDRGDIDWNVLKQKYDFAFVKITGGSTFIDPCGRENILNAKKHGMLVGGYHFARFNSIAKAKEEAKHFLEHVKGLALDYVILDIEHREAKGDLTDAAIAFLDIVSQAGTPLLYSYPYFIKSHFNHNITKYPLWIAHYGVKKPSIFFWKQWKVWQYTSSAQLDSIAGNVDVDYMKEGFAKELPERVQLKPKHKHKPKKEHQIKTKKYPIKSGQTFWELENKWHLRHGLLQKLNSNVDPRRLSVGQKINIPASVHKEEKHVKRHTKIYTVKSGDYLSKIASKFNTSVEHIMQLNPQIDDPDKIYPGEKIKLVKGSNDDKRRYHDVVSGDTLSEIAKDNHTTIRRLMQLNPNIDDKDEIYVGQKIRVK